MEKLTETINSLKVSKTTKEKIIKIAEIEELQIQQVCRRLLTKAIKEYFSKDENIVNQLQKNYKYGV
jgi:UDP-galactopyranose mutase